MAEKPTVNLPENAIAIIGLAGRFPDAGTVEEFWQNIRAGRESVRSFTDEELAANGDLPHPKRNEPNYVRARACLHDRAMFDAKFFGYPPREAEQMDPQQRIFLECAWEAMEDAGYDSERYAGAVGVYAGCYMDSYIFSNLCAQPGFLKNFTVELQVGALGPELSNDKDHIATRVAFKLNLRGPAINVQTACSTSLVAVCQAVQALLTQQCDMALAGGATIAFRHATGYLHQEGGMLSSDGHCRAYDHRATGTVFGEGVACVLLKRLEDAIADGDHITAVIRAAALNNDGAAKVSYAAPSVAGQTEVIALAHAIADIDASTIQYVEGHGTGTPLGDPIEVAALTAAFRASTELKQFCALGSVKPNIGHLDTASGVAGMIKAALALRDRVIPPLINFEQPNPQIDFANSPFYLPTQLQPWAESKVAPRRAGVSSFGVGGTNAHVVLEEAPALPARPPITTPQILLLSAKSPAALENMTARLAAHLRAHPELSLADIGHTLQVGRRQMNLRRAFVARDAAAAIAALESGDAKKLPTANQDRRDPPVIFMFPGQGSQYVGMGVELYHSQPVFRAEMDRCAEILRPHLGFDLREAIYAAPENKEAATAQLTQTRITQPAIFATEYAIARQWMAWGIQPAAMIGHSVGEYVAGCLAGVFSLEDALALVAARARLVQEMPPGGMLAVRLPESEVVPLLGTDLSLAAVNSPNLCVVAGPFPAIEALEAKLTADGKAARRLHTSHGFHSAMMEPVVAPFTEVLARVPLHAPAIPYVSNVTGQWVTAAETTDPAYWAAHVRQAVRFADGIGTLLANPDYVFLETGPGTTLNTLTRQRPSRSADRVILSSLPASNDGAAELDTLLTSVAQLWLAGCSFDWSALSGAEKPRRVPLPTYPFERKKYWLEPLPFEAVPAAPVPAMPAITPVALPPVFDSLPAIVSPPSVQKLPMSTPSRREKIISELKRILYDLSGIELTDSDATLSFLELGFDSLLLTQARQSLQSSLGISVTFRQLMDDFGNLDALANHADSVLPPDAFAAPVAAPAPTLQPLVPLAALPSSNGALSVEQLIVQQLQLMQYQLAALRGAPVAPAPPIVAAPAPAAAPVLAATPKPTAPAAAKTAEATVAHGPFKPQNRGRTDGLTEQQQAALDRLITRYNRKTGKSKELTQKHRRHFCDPRAAGNFRQLWKEMVYPIACARSKGSKIWDIDGNEYVDVTLGFGVHFLGHSPDFVIEAVQEQLKKGTEIGPQSPLAGEVAQMITEFSGMERVTFCNTGSEAVMAAMRVARTVTGRNKIAMFSGDYHGMFDSVLVRGFKTGGKWRTAPIAPGIPQSQVDDMVVLELNNPESLEYLRAHASEIAAVIVEPVQARNPDVQPRDFLHALRTLTKETGMLYVFDEVITGFRCAPGGAQEYFGVRADLATYGKIVGGGIPIGVLAGKAEYMDVLDGGHWQYGDTSFPEVGVTFFAGTFVRHPLAMAAAHAVLRHLKEQGPALQQRISEKAKDLVASLNELFREHGVPMSLMNFCSLMHYELDAKWEFAGLLFYYLRDRGVHIWEGRLGFISCAHTDEDLDFLFRAFRDAVIEMKEGGFLPEGPLNPGPRGLPTDHHSAPLTAPQQEIWTTTKFAPEATNAYNESNTLTLRGPLQVEKMRAAFTEVVNRHDALRATFAADGSQQTFTAFLNFALPQHDLTALPAAERETKAQALIAEDLSTSFDLGCGPLIRAQLIRLSDDEHRLQITAHHLVCDGWSFDVVQSELADIYSGLVRGSPPEIGPPPRFADYARQEIVQRNSPEALADEEFWVQAFQTIPEPIALPGDRPHPLQRSYRGAREEFLLPPELGKALTKLGGRNGCTLFAVLLAGFQTLLHRLSGSSDLVVGISAAGQNLAELPGLVGHCVNILPLRVQTSANLSVRGLLQSVRRAMMDAFDHPRLSFGRLVQRLQIPRESGRIPLVPIIFNLDPSLRDLRFEGLTHETATSPRQAYQFDLGWNVVATRSGLRIECDYNTDLFDPATIQRWLEHYRILLEGMTADAEAAISRLPLLLPGEEETLVRTWNQTALEFSSEATLPTLFAESVSRSPAAVALLDHGLRMSYRELDEASDRMAQWLIARGVAVGDRVAVCGRRSAGLIAALLGVLKTGAAYVPIEPDYPEERRAAILQDAGAKIVLSDSQTLAELADAHAAVAWLPWENPPTESAPAPLPRFSPSDLAYILFTSGSTGRPKGVALEHRNAVAFTIWARASFSAEEFSGVLFATSLCFDLSIFEIFATLSAGGTVIVARDILELPEHPDASVVRLINTVPSAIADLVHRQQIPANARTINLAGEPLSEKLVENLLASGTVRRVNDLYGPTETTTYSTWTRRRSGELANIGHPISNTQIYLLDPQLQLVPTGVVGRLWIAGAGVARGYWQQAQMTAERFLDNPFTALDPAAGPRMYDTGDLARYLPDGRIVYLGRADHQIKLRGFRIERGEIEAVLSQHHDILSGAVILRQNDQHEPHLAAYYTTRENASPSVTELREHLAAKLPHYMIPSAFIRLATLPLNANGKLDLRALPAPETTALPTTDDELPQNSTEGYLVELWEEMLQTRPIGTGAIFFDLGGHSLLAAEMLARVQKISGFTISLAKFMNAPTIVGLAKALGQAEFGTLPDPALLAMNETGTRTPLFFFHGHVYGGLFFCRAIARHLGPDQPFYAVHPHGMDGSVPPGSIEKMAAERIRAIREVQPAGPYYLGGYCNGGYVAIEAARQLEAAGERVISVLLIAADAGNVWFRTFERWSRLTAGLRRETPDQTRQRFLRLRSRFIFLLQWPRLWPALQQEARRNGAKNRASLLGRKIGIAWRHLTKARNGSTNPLPLLEDTGYILERPVDPLLQIYHDTCEAYVPKRIAAQIVLLWPEEQAPLTPGDPTAEWKSVSRDVRWYPIPGDHRSAVTEREKIEALAEILQQRVKNMLTETSAQTR